MTEELKEEAKEDVASRFIQIIGYEDRVMVKRISEAVRYGFDKGAQFVGIQWHDLKEDPSDVPKGYIHRKILLQDRHGYIYTGNYYPKDDCHPEDCFAVEWLDKGFQGSNFVAFEQIAKWAEFKE